MGTLASASSRVEVPDFVSAAAEAAKASYLSASSDTRIGGIGQDAVPARTASATGPARGTTGVTGMARRCKVAPRMGSRRETSVRRLPGIMVSSFASGAMPWRARKRAASPRSAPLSSTGWPTKLPVRLWRAKNAGSNGNRHSRRSQRPG